jgi:IS4 transposase
LLKKIPNGFYRSQAKLGTCSFYAYATIYVIKKDKRLTLAICAIRRTDTMVAVISYLLNYVFPLKLNFKTLYLDRGFFSISVIRWLQALKIPFIMPAIRRGKTGGINQFLLGGKSYKTTYTMFKNKEDFVTFNLWIVCKYLKGKRNKKGVEYFAYVVYKPYVSLDYIHQSYRQRFGIESSYRIKNICRIKTTNKNPIIRLLFIGISFIVVNIWINLLWKKVSQPRRGGRLIYHSLFTFKQMLSFLSHSIDQIYQIVDGIYLPSG